MKTQGSIRVRTPAKVTLALHVERRRADGYHDVRLVLAPVALYDTLVLRPRADGRLRLRVTGADSLGPAGDNLVHRAARDLAAAAGRPLGADIALHKRIPAGAGLGGGSGNAAGTLIALNRLLPTPLPPDRLHALALALGSDVPFFLAPRPGVAEGRGERLRPLAGFPTLPLLLVKPAFGIATAEAYALVHPRPAPPAPAAMTTPADVLAALHNDFEAVLLPRHPELGEIKARLRALGAAGAVLSGSGSAVVGLFERAAARDEAAAALAAEGRWWLHPCETLPGHAYDPESVPAEG